MISGKTIWSLWNSLLQEFLQEQYKPRQYKGYFLYLVKCSIIKEAQTTVADTLGSLIFRDNFHKSETGELGPAKKSPWNLKAKVITVHFLSKCFSATLCFSDLYYWKEKNWRAFSRLYHTVKSLKAFYFHLAQIPLWLLPAHPPSNSKSRLCVKNKKHSVHMHIIFKKKKNLSWCLPLNFVLFFPPGKPVYTVSPFFTFSEGP